MSVGSWKAYKAFFTYQEATPFTADTDEFFEGRGRMMLPEPEYQVESDYNKLGSGEHGTKNELQAVWTPWSYTCDRMSEIAYMMSYFQGEADSFVTVEATSTAYSHRLNHLPIASRNMPTFTYQIGSDTIVSGNIINEMSISFASGGNGVVEATFSGFGNRHIVNNGAFVLNSAGSLATGENSFASEPLLNFKCLNFWAADSVTLPGKTSVSYEGADMGTNLINLTTYLNSITITGNNGMTAADMARAGGCGVINDRVRGDRRYTLEFALRKDNSVINNDNDRIADTQRAYEVQFAGPDIVAGYPYALDMFFPVVQVGSAPEDDASPINRSYATEVFEDSDGISFVAYVQSAVAVGYNATKA